MKIISLANQATRSIDRFGSSGFDLGALGHGELVVHTAVIAAGGRIGRHPAASAQLLTPVTGTVEVAGSDGAFGPLAPGSAVVWAAGEEHETRSTGHAVVIIIEGAALTV